MTIYFKFKTSTKGKNLKTFFHIDNTVIIQLVMRFLFAL